jgi:hypothetical protein
MKRIHSGTLCLAFALVVASSAAAAQSSPPPAAPAQAPAAAAATTASAPGPAPATPVAKPQQVLVPVGTVLPLVLHNGISTRNAHPGDPVYLETLFPILVDGHIVIPAGSYVSGEVTDAKRPGKVKGRGEIMFRLTTLILPNGYSASFAAVPSNASNGEDDSISKEGKITGPSNKAGDTGTVVKSTAAGAGIGAIAGGGKGAGIGAGAGAVAGLIGVLLTRGPELQFPRGSTLDVTLDRPLYLDAAHVQFTDPGRASTLAGPSNRDPARPGSPF